jgi:hypothetical protein
VKIARATKQQNVQLSVSVFIGSSDSVGKANDFA